MSTRPRAVLLALLLPAGAMAQVEAGSETRIGAAKEDVYAAGGRVEAAEPVEGDLVVAGGELRLSGPVWGDVLAGGGSVEISGDVRDDVRAGGGRVRVLGAVGDAVVLAGGAVEIGPAARVGGRALIAGGEVQVLGKLEGGVRVAGGRVEIGGQVTGDVEATAEELRILPGARIGGVLRYASPRPAEVSPEARVAGGIVQVPLPDRGSGAAGAVVLGLLWIFGLALLGIVLVALLPGASAEVVRIARAEPGRSLGVGLGVLVATPIVVGISAVTVVGTPLALVAIVLWLLLGLVGYLGAALALGEWGLAKLGRATTARYRFLALLAALAVLRVVRLVPFLGALVLIAAVVFGMGAIVVALARRRRAASATAGPPAAVPGTG